MVVWDRVTRGDVLRAIHEYDRLGPEQFFASMVSRPRRPMSWFGINTGILLRQSWAQLMSSPRGKSLARVTSKVGRLAP
jgi:hypothetical protein